MGVHQQIRDLTEANQRRAHHRCDESLTGRDPTHKPVWGAGSASGTPSDGTHLVQLRAPVPPLLGPPV